MDNVVEEMGMNMGQTTGMDTKRWVVDPNQPPAVLRQAVQEAAQLLQQGEVVAFPTETVYGLGANCFSSEAVRKIFAAKGRPSDNPLIVHIADEAWLEDLVSDVPEAARRLMAAFWPGPLTLILPSNGRVAPEVTGGLSTVAVRMPDHPVAQALIAACGFPLAAPSANRSGRPSPTQAEHVLDDLAGRIAGVVDGGPVSIGTESTVVDVCGSNPAILRPGGITREELEAVLQQPVETVKADAALAIEPTAVAGRDTTAAGDGPADSEASYVPRSPGMKYTHYAPRGEMWLVCGTPEAMRQRIVQEATARLREGKRVGILTTEEGIGAYRQQLAGQPVILLACGRRREPASVARELYGCLRQFDAAGAGVIYAEAIPEEGIGAAVMNRLVKASGGRLLQA